MDIELAEKLFPRLPLGVEVLFRGEHRIWIGGRERGIEISKLLRFFSLEQIEGGLLPALRALNGERSVEEIATYLDIDKDNFLRLLRFLESEGLLKFSLVKAVGSKKLLVKRYSRREIEFAHLTSDSAMKRRGEFKIEIVGHDRIATSIAALLFGSGFSSIRLTTNNYGETLNTSISDLDLGLGVLNGTDIGAVKCDRFHQISNRNAIAPLETEIRNGQIARYGEGFFQPDLSISIGYPRSDYHQRWISEDKKFLIVPGYSQSIVTIGPFVIPGQTPCLRCFELNAAENNFWSEQVRALEPLSEPIAPPLIAASITAAHTAAAITSFLDSEENSNLPHHLLGRQMLIDLTKDGQFKYRNWSTHPECGCTWSSFNKSPESKSTQTLTT